MRYPAKTIKNDFLLTVRMIQNSCLSETLAPHLCRIPLGRRTHQPPLDSAQFGRTIPCRVQLCVGQRQLGAQSVAVCARGHGVDGQMVERVNHGAWKNMWFR